MKKIVIFAAAALMMSSYSMLQKSSPPATAATTTAAAPAVGVAASPSTAGLNAGTALLALYKQYQIDGKFNASNLQNIANAVSPASSASSANKILLNVHRSSQACLRLRQPPKIHDYEYHRQIY